ncbi:MAG: nucleotide exchange factor GrpE [Candidatus Saliniplasma sp.]
MSEKEFVEEEKESEGSDEEITDEEITDEEITDEQDKSEDTEEELTKEQLEEEVDELERSLKKVMADFDNYRKRTLREKKRIIERATEDLMLDLLSVLDDFERAIGSDDELDSEGIQMIYKKFYHTLKEHGLEEFEAEGEEFDPKFHECVMSVDAENEEDKDMVIEQFEKGYKLNSKVIRPAKVKVAN